MINQQPPHGVADFQEEIVAGSWSILNSTIKHDE